MPSEDRKKQEENPPTVTLNDSINKSQSPSPDVSGMGWNDLLLLVIIVIGGFFFYQWFF
ncbi:MULTISPECIES: DUF6366 family protein [Cytobacillus]|uniref:DUF6366 family protein n=1 Tax=Cytobacillus TaxID=2675230 RepID=UPI001CD68BF5|nr:DUF6366 family protein [Cytobacillus kochii]MCA1026943.1 DUF6366 family protein [Cytobacillus kochii]